LTSGIEPFAIAAMIFGDVNASGARKPYVSLNLPSCLAISGRHVALAARRDGPGLKRQMWENRHDIDAIEARLRL